MRNESMRIRVYSTTRTYNGPYDVYLDAIGNRSSFAVDYYCGNITPGVLHHLVVTVRERCVLSSMRSFLHVPVYVPV